ncbi:MAG: hypothetical protein WC933_01105 [Candidatus Paceibacterota bacterium]|jgi:hypothetical protein
MKTFFKIFGLSFVWFSVWAVFILYLQPQGIDYENRYILTSVYFLLIIVALTSIFKKEIGNYVDNFSAKDLLIMVIFSVAVTSIYYFVSLLIEGNSLYAIKNSLPPILQLDDKFLVTKAFEIMFQQTFFMISIYYLFNNNVSKKIDMILFGLYAMFIHFPILFVDSSMGKILFGVSFFAGLIFSYCITKSKKGFIYSYMIHFGFYVVLAMIFWLGGAQYIAGLI